MHDVKGGTVRRIALVYNARSEFDLKVMAGVAAYIQDRRRPVARNSDECVMVRIHDVCDFPFQKADGVVTRLDAPDIGVAALNATIPVVGFGQCSLHDHRDTGVPYLCTDNAGVSELAAHHLFNLGLRTFAYVPLCSRTSWDKQREHAFVRRAHEQGVDCFVYENAGDAVDDEGSLGRWLMRLPKPIGIMVANDARACDVIEICHASGLKIPSEVAVVGVDNNELLCALSLPSLTSVDLSAARMGYEAADLLHRLMDGQRIASRVIEPAGVIARQSTISPVIRDPFVIRAVGFIESHHAKPIKVSDVANASGVSASVLESRFVKAFGRTISSAIRDARLKHVKELISETDVPLKQIAPQTGFRSVQHMTTLFRKAFGHSPARYRKLAALANLRTAVAFDASDVAVSRGTAA